MAITCNEEGLIIDLPLKWRLGLDATHNWREWGIGVSVYYHHRPNQHIGVFLTILPFYVTIDIWSRKAGPLRVETTRGTSVSTVTPINTITSLDAWVPFTYTDNDTYTVIDETDLYDKGFDEAMRLQRELD